MIEGRRVSLQFACDVLEGDLVEIDGCFWTRCVSGYVPELNGPPRGSIALDVAQFVPCGDLNIVILVRQPSDTFVVAR